MPKQTHRCGACNKKFESAKDLINHIKNECILAIEMKNAMDKAMPLAEILSPSVEKKK